MYQYCGWNIDDIEIWAVDEDQIPGSGDWPGAGPAIRVLSLDAVCPNPVSRDALIHYALPTESQVSLRVFDLQGRLVATPIKQLIQPGGRYITWWNGATDTGSKLSPGTYLLRLNAADQAVTKKLIVVR
jgi:hypothetical protein